MANNSKPQPEKPLNQAVIDWLLDGDPAIRWQTMRDLVGSSADAVAAERARVSTEGVGAQLLALQEPDGSWSGTAFNHGWDSTMHILSLLRELGLDPMSPEAQNATARVREGVTWRGWDWNGTWRGMDFEGTPFFAGEVEPCINGQVAASGAYFRQDVTRIIDRLLGEQLADGGWNCEAENRSIRSSFNTTICVLEGLLEYELAGGGDTIVREARLRGQEYLLERQLFLRQSTGEVVNPAWLRFSFPNWWHYDVLRGLDYLRKAQIMPDKRLQKAVDLVRSKRRRDGRWLLEHQHEGRMLIEVNEGVGQPSRWITLKALRILDWISSQ